MKTIIFLVGLLAIIVMSCDKVENPYPYDPSSAITNDYGIDTSFFAGTWGEYLADYYPVFESEGSNEPNVLLEDYTGHTCNNCPNAGKIAHDISQENPDRVYVVAVHAGPGGMTSFQNYNPNADKFYTNHTNEEGLGYGEHFQNGFNFFGNPQGTVNRKTVDDKLFDFSGTWSTRASNVLNTSGVNVKIQSVFNYFPETQGGYLHVELEKNTDEAAKINTVVYVVKDSEINWQVMADNSYNEFYEHKNKHLGSIDKRPWGLQTFDETDENGTKVILDYAYKIPDELTIDNMHFIIYAYNTETYEIYQVVKQRVD